MTHLGDGLLLAAGLAMFFLGVVIGVVRHGGPESRWATGGAGAAPGTGGPGRIEAAAPSLCPPAGAVGAAVLVLGVVFDRFLLFVGLTILVAAAAVWFETTRRLWATPTDPADHPIGVEGGADGEPTRPADGGAEAIRPCPTDPMVDALVSTRLGLPILRTIEVLFLAFAAYLLFDSLTLRSGNALVGMFALALSVPLFSWLNAMTAASIAHRSTPRVTTRVGDASGGQPHSS